MSKREIIRTVICFKILYDFTSKTWELIMSYSLMFRVFKLINKHCFTLINILPSLLSRYFRLFLSNGILYILENS